MSIVVEKFELPNRLIWEEETATDTYTKFIAEPFERGYGFTLGNALRRVLLSSLEGAAITSVKIEGAMHEFSSLPGVYEDVTSIILNLKKIVLKMDGRDPKTITLEAKGARDVTAADIDTGGLVEVVNPDQHIASLGKGASLKMEMRVKVGRGYVPAEANKEPETSLGVIPIDSIFTPVRKVNYYVQDTRVGQRTDYHKLMLEIWTDGRLTPKEALIRSSAILKKHLDLFTDYGSYTIEFAGAAEEKEKEEEDRLQKLLDMPISEIELSVRSSNCIKAAKIETIRDLVTKSESEMLKYRNFGKKSLEEIKEILAKLGLSLGMQLPALPEEAGEEAGIGEEPLPEEGE